MKRFRIIPTIISGSAYYKLEREVRVIDWFPWWTWWKFEAYETDVDRLKKFAEHLAQDEARLEV